MSGQPTDQVPLALVAALPEELSAIRRRLEGVTSLGGDPPAQAARFAGERVVLAVLGTGPRLAKRRLAALLAAHRVRGVLLVGLAGALDPTLLRNDVIIASGIVAIDRQVPALDRAWFAHASTQSGLHAGVIVTTAHVVARAEDKAALRAHFAGRPIAVDMESAAVAEVTASHGLPLLVVRAVSDTAEETLPDFLGDASGPEGELSRWRLVRSLLVRPSRIRALADLRRRAQQGARALANAVEGILALDTQSAGDDRTSGV